MSRMVWWLLQALGLLLATSALLVSSAPAFEEQPQTNEVAMMSGEEAADSEDPDGLNYLKQYLVMGAIKEAELDRDGRSQRARPEQLDQFNIDQILEAISPSIPLRGGQQPMYRSSRNYPRLTMLHNWPSDLSLDWLITKLDGKARARALQYKRYRQLQKAKDKRYEIKGLSWFLPNRIMSGGETQQQQQQQSSSSAAARLRVGGTNSPATSDAAASSSRPGKVGGEEVVPNATPSLAAASGPSGGGGGAGSSDYESEWKRMENSRWNNLRGMWGKRAA